MKILHHNSSGAVGIGFIKKPLGKQRLNEHHSTELSATVRD